jgi:hypothetical protein
LYSTGITAAPDPVCRPIRQHFSAHAARHATSSGRPAANASTDEIFPGISRSEQVMAPYACASVRTAVLRHPDSSMPHSLGIVGHIMTHIGIARGRGRGRHVPGCRRPTVHTGSGTRRQPEGVCATRVANVTWAEKADERTSRCPGRRFRCFRVAGCAAIATARKLQNLRK